MTPPHRILAFQAGIGALSLTSILSAATQNPTLIAATLLATTTTLALASARPDLGLFGPTLNRVSSFPGVVLTFDDGPHPDTTPIFLDTLARYQARATFFVLLDRVTQWPHLYRAILEQGHEIGLHGATHSARYTYQNPRTSAAELTRAALALQAYGAPPIRWFRPPFGAVSPRLFEATRLAGLSVAWCSVRTRDGVPIAKSLFLERAKKARAGDILLMHDQSATTQDALPELLAFYQSQGLTMASLGQAAGE